MTSISRHLLLTISCLLLWVGHAQAQITTTFNSNAEGWTTPMDADATIGYSATGGNPAGHVFGSPFVFVGGAGTFYFNFYFVAPPAYLGNRSAYYNGTLRYDIQQSTPGAANQYAEVTIASGAGVTLYYYPTVSNQPSSPPLWSTFIVIMNNTLGFWKTTDSPSGPLATEVQIQNVLSDLASLQIRGLYRNANTTNRMDNVAFSPPIIITTQPTNASVCQGVSANLTTAATGNPSITYQWQRFIAGVGYVDLSNDAVYSGVTTTNLSVNTSTGAGAGNYRCRISGTNVVSVFTNIVSITVNTPPVAPGVTGASSCGPSTVTLNASGGSAGQYRWYTVPTGGTPIGGQTNSTYTTPVIATTTTYYVSINNGTCESARTSVTATINTNPTAPSTTGNASCGPAAVTLNASGGSAGQYRWYTVPTGGTAIVGQTNSTYTTPVIATTTTYYVSINNGTCESARTSVTATINSIPTPPGTTGNSSCGPAAMTLNASGGSAGQYRWYTVPTGGTAIGGQTNSTYTTPVITTTTTYYVSINNGTCESARTSVTATINTNPTAPSTTGNASCGPAAVTLNASGGSAGQYRWHTVPTGGAPIGGQTNSTYTTPVIATTTTYYVSINNGTCESARTSVTATINTIPTAPTTTANASCGPAAVTLNASGGSAGQYRWYTVPTGGTPIVGQTNSSYTTPVIATTTTYYVSINNGTCESARTSVTATINTNPTAPSTTGNASCGPAAVTLNASGGSAGQYRWYTVPTGGTAIGGQTNSTFTTPVIATTTTYYVSINNGTCESARTSVTATINTNPTAPSTTGNASCGPAAVTLNASGGSAGQYRWYTVSSGGTPIAGQTNSTYTTPVIAGTTPYYVSINNGTCESTRTSVTATINTIPTAPTTTANASCGPAAVTLNASGGSAGQYRWYTVPTGGTPIGGQTNSTYTTPVIATTTTYYVSINNGTCESARISVTATINTNPTAPSTTGNASCGSAAMTLNASGGSAGQYRWYTVPTGGTPIGGQTNSTYTTPVITSTTTYYVSINNGTCESTRMPVIATINAIPASPNVTGASSCTPTQLTLSASGTSDGSYLWYDLPTGGNAIGGEVNSTFTTPTLSNTTDFFVSIHNGSCESSRVMVTATIGGTACTNTPPAIATSNQSTTIEGLVTLNLLDLISDADDNLDPGSLKIITQPTSGADAQINNGILTINYSGLGFTGQDKIRIEVCDLLGSCSEQEFTIEVTGELQVYNGISPNNDPYNNKWIISNIASLPDTRSNHVSIFNRWGDVVFEIDDYDNQDRAFTGVSNKGKELGGGVYFYKIEFKSGRKTMTGYLTVKK